MPLPPASRSRPQDNERVAWSSAARHSGCVADRRAAQDHVRLEVAQQREAVPEVGLVPVLPDQRLPGAPAREQRVARGEVRLFMG
jgi:hypothetical protein